MDRWHSACMPIPGKINHRTWGPRLLQFDLRAWPDILLHDAARSFFLHARLPGTGSNARQRLFLTAIAGGANPAVLPECTGEVGDIAIAQIQRDLGQRQLVLNQ